MHETSARQLRSIKFFSILPSAQNYEENRFGYIDKQTEEAVKSDGFATIERSLLEAVVVRDTLTIEEIELFNIKAVRLWATKECDRQGLAADGASKRRILEEHVIKRIRFPTMKQEEFATVMLDSKTKEVFSIIKYLSSVSSSPVDVLETKRCGLQFDAEIQRCCRFGSLSPLLWIYQDDTDALGFSVDKDIVLEGVCLFGSENAACSVEQDVTDSCSESSVASKIGEFS